MRDTASIVADLRETADQFAVDDWPGMAAQLREAADRLADMGNKLTEAVGMWEFNRAKLAAITTALPTSPPMRRRRVVHREDAARRQLLRHHHQSLDRPPCMASQACDGRLVTLEPGTRVVVTGGPWPERRGEHGVIVDGPAIYPFHGVSQHEVVIHLDDDPLYEPFDPERPFSYHADHETWSCVICRRDLELE